MELANAPMELAGLYESAYVSTISFEQIKTDLNRVHKEIQ